VGFVTDVTDVTDFPKPLFNIAVLPPLGIERAALSTQSEMCASLQNADCRKAKSPRAERPINIGPDARRASILNKSSKQITLCHRLPLNAALSGTSGRGREGPQTLAKDAIERAQVCRYCA